MTSLAYADDYNSRPDVVHLMLERYDTKSNVKFGGLCPSFKRPTCLATLKRCDTTKQSVCGRLYICMYIACMVMINVVRDGHSDPSSNPVRGCLDSQKTLDQKIKQGHCPTKYA